MPGERAADAVIVAAGSSRRMGGVDKLLAPIAGRPLIAWTVAAIAAAPSVDRIVLVTAPERVGEWRDARWLRAVDGVVAVVAGGPTRQVSVANGVRHLAALSPDDSDRPVLVHDGARPLATAALVDAVVAAVQVHGAALPVLPVAETLKRVDHGRVVETVDRASLATAQTPQGARRSVLLRAWETFPPEGDREFTDEAALLEACKITVHAIPGDPANRKVTLPDDLRHVELALGPAAPRVGFGHDSHPFGPGAPLRLGGVTVDGVPALAGHSDGDVALHAVADALLGAAGLGDLGRLFPADARTPRGVASDALLREVVERLAAARPRTRDGRPRHHRRPAEARRSAGRHARRRSLRRSASTRAPSTSRRRPATWPGDEGAGRSISARAVATVRERRA